MSFIESIGMVTEVADLDLAERRKLFLMETENKPARRINDLTRGFEVSHAGVFFTYEQVDEKEPKKIRVCSELLVTALVRDRESNNWGLLIEFKDPDGIPHSWVLPMEFLASDGIEMRKELVRMGLQIEPTNNARYKLIEFLNNSRPTARVVSVHQTGWFENVFVMPDKTIGESAERILFQSEGKVSCQYRTNGTLDEWRDNVAKKCIGNSRLMLAVSSAFGGMLLHHAKLESGGIHFVGGSSCGKSTAQSIAASVFGSPSFKQSWRATGNALEGTCAIHNDAALILDEMAEVDPREIGNIVYMIGNGTGKGRAGRSGAAKQRKTWRVMIISSGEIGLAQHMQDGGKVAKAGQEVRLIDIDADAEAGFGIFEELHGHQSGASLSDALKDAAQTYYGTAAIAFLEKVSIESKEIGEYLRTSIRDFVVANLPYKAGGQAERICNRFALIATAGELATKLDITGWRIGDAINAARVCFASWVDSRGDGENQEVRTILSKVKAFFELHGESRFSDVKDTSGRITTNRVGFCESTLGGKLFYVLPEAYRSEICAGFNFKQVSKVLRERGWLIPDNEGKSLGRKTLPGMKSTRCYVFSEKMWED
jgi:putative DNA primase/helicase